LPINNADYGDLSIRINDGPWHPVPFPERVPEPHELYFSHWNPAIEIPLAELGAQFSHTFEMRVGEQRPGGNTWHPPWNPLYSASLRIYYDPARKAHPTARITRPHSSDTLTERVVLQADLPSPPRVDDAHIARIDFVGRYRDVDYEGDGTLDGWHGRLKNGVLEKHLGTTHRPGQEIVWDASWVPDQSEPMAIAARVVDATGLTYVTEAVQGLRIERPGFHVELANSDNPPPAFTACQYGTWIHQGRRTQQIHVQSDVARIVDARLVFVGWNAPAWRRFSLNDIWLEETRTEDGAGNHLLLTLPLRPLSALHSGENEMATIPDAGRQMDVFFPGLMVLVRTTTSQAAKVNPASAPAFTNALGMAFARMEPDIVSIGSPENEEGHVWEDRMFRAEVTKPYLIGTTEVTQRQFQQEMGFNPSGFRAPNHPVENVTWNDAVVFCARLSKSDGHTYRLPTEVEWEMAARAGTQTPFAFGSVPSSSLANFDARTTYGTGIIGIFRGTTTPVGTFAPNGAGLCDMHGNVWEWCSDWYGEYPKETATDWQGPSPDKRLEANRILRGGAFNAEPRFIRSSFRHRLAPDTAQPSIGFRVVRELP
jgi:formylglycine-generating enzyme